jgi:hypothetical protein
MYGIRAALPLAAVWGTSRSTQLAGAGYTAAAWQERTVTLLITSGFAPSSWRRCRCCTACSITQQRRRRVAENSIYHDAQHQSRILLPIIPANTANR